MLGVPRMTAEQIFPVARKILPPIYSSRYPSFLLSPPPSLSFYSSVFSIVSTSKHTLARSIYYRYIIDSFYPKIVVLSVSHWYFYCAYEGIVWLYRVKVHATLSLFFFFKFEQRKIFCYLYNFSSQEIIANHEQLFIMHFECKRIL